MPSTVTSASVKQSTSRLGFWTAILLAVAAAAALVVVSITVPVRSGPDCLRCAFSVIMLCGMFDCEECCLSFILLVDSSLGVGLTQSTKSLSCVFSLLHAHSFSFCCVLFLLLGFLRDVNVSIEASVYPLNVAFRYCKTCVQY